MSFYNDHKDEAIVEINVVPLVDIVLVILIIFMVSAPIFMKPSLVVNLPKTTSGTDSKPTHINITISKNGDIDLNGDKVSLDDIGTKTAKALASSSESGANVSADKEVQHGIVIQVLDKLHTAGVKKFSINVEHSN